MKKTCFIAAILCVAWIASVVYYGETAKLLLQSSLEVIFFISMSVLIKARRDNWAYILKGVLFIALYIYFIECAYYSRAGEFISLLALENIDQAYLLIRPLYVMIVVMVFSFCLWAVYGRLDISRKKKKIFSICLILSFVGATLQNVIGGGTPVFSFFKNIVEDALGTDMTAEKINGYPFQKEWIYKSELPYPQVRSQGTRPNIIVIFTEGTSARLLGCYNDKYRELTPNLDDFARQSMVVDRYYNHTTATFRGTQGQLASCYPFHGGSERGGWVGLKEGTGLAKQLAAREYQTLPKILNQYGYTTTFLSPHIKSDPYTDLLCMLGFQQVYTRDDASTILERQVDPWHLSLTDNDMYSELVKVLEDKKDESPFFIAMYTFETHTNVDTPDNGVKFGDGKNETLNTLRNTDSAFSAFWQYFQQSRYRDNTIVIFTADHCHYHDKSFMSLVAGDSDYVKCFYDRIPLIVFDPVHELPQRYDAENNTSLSLTPTICQLLGINGVENSFMGASIFERESLPVLCDGFHFYSIHDDHVAKVNELPPEDLDEVRKKIAEIKLFYKCEDANRVFHASEVE